MYMTISSQKKGCFSFSKIFGLMTKSAVLYKCGGQKAENIACVAEDEVITLPNRKQDQAEIKL